jgi:shikimate dehydrogenase
MYPNHDTILIGRVASSLSKNGHYIYNKYYQSHDINAIYLQFKVSEIGPFINHIGALGFRGCNITGTHVKTILPLLDHIEPQAKLVGAINTLVIENGKFIGYKTDGPGLLLALKEVTQFQGKKVVIVGAGKLATEMALRLPNEGANEVLIFNRTADKAKELADKTSTRFGGGLEDVVSANGDILLNCTDIGAAWCDVKDFFREQTIDKFETVFDTTFKPVSTPLIEKAVKLGKKVVPGTRFFAYQGALSVELYLGNRPSIDDLASLVVEEFTKYA